MNDPDAVRRLKANADRLGRSDIANACSERIFELEGQNVDDPIEKRLWEAISAYEETLREKHGKSVKATYTRRKINAKGAIQTLLDWARDEKVTPGFKALVSAGLAKYTGEYVVVEFSDSFPEDAVRSAKSKLLAAGMQESDFPN